MTSRAGGGRPGGSSGKGTSGDRAPTSAAMGSNRRNACLSVKYLRISPSREGLTTRDALSASV